MQITQIISGNNDLHIKVVIPILICYDFVLLSLRRRSCVEERWGNSRSRNNKLLAERQRQVFDHRF